MKMCRVMMIGLAAVSLTAGAAFSQTDHEPGPWKYGAVLGLNLSQSAFSDEWPGGDKGSINWVLNADLDAQRQVSRKLNWSNLLQLAYGQTSQQVVTDPKTQARSWATPDKTTDLVLFESVGRFTLDSFVDPYVSFRLDSQFVDETDPYNRSLTFNPVKLTETAGVARVLQKTEESELVTRLGFGLRQTFASAFRDTVGDGTESFSTNDGGLEWQTEATYPLLDNRVQYKGKLLVFLPVFFSLSDELDEYDARGLSDEAVTDFWKDPDVNFQNSFSSDITEWLSVNLYLQWVYDKFDAATNVDPSLADDALRAEVESGIRKSGQFKQTLALGLSYRFL